MTTIPNMPAQRPDDPRGLLTWDGLLPEPWQSAEDSTLANDFRVRVRRRPTTPSERALLEHLGYELPADLITHVQFLSATVRRRTWTDIKIPTPNTEG